MEYSLLTLAFSAQN